MSFDSKTLLSAAGLCAVAVPALATPNAVGINVNYLHDSDDTPVLADLMRTYRFVNTTDSPYYSNNAPLDSSGWATSDAWYFLGDANYEKHGDGTYAIKFSGQATIGLGQYNTAGKVQNQVYDAATNTTTARLLMNPNSDLVDIRFTNTQRTAASGTNTGVSNIQIMRPTSPGGTTPYAFGTTFTTQTIDIAKKVGVLRFMDYLAANGNTQVNWADRGRPVDIKPNKGIQGNSRGNGGPLEYAVEMGNEANRDIWINIPVKASDDYVTKVAQLIKYGSDGTNPYTGPTANPVYKPLSPNLHVYLEYSNETWNSQFQQYLDVETLGKAELAKEQATGNGIGPMNFVSGYDKQVYIGQRYTALRTKQIADIFSGVYGDGAMLNTVRPILSWQVGGGQDSANQMQLVLDGYYNNSKGDYVANPTPMNKYIYGGGSTYYYTPTSPNNDLTVDKILTEPLGYSTSKAQSYARDMTYASMFGIKRVGYEGGLVLDPGTTAETTSSLATKLSALADPRMTQMVVTNHNQWTGYGGDLLCYYFASGQYQYAYTDENFSTTTPKLNALDQLSSSERSTTYLIGTPLSRTAATVLSGGQFTIKDDASNPFTGAVSLQHNQWTAYLINIAQAGDYQLVAHYKLYNGTGAFKLILGGAVLADFTGLVPLSNYTGTTPLTLTLPAGITSLRVLMDTNSTGVSIYDLTFTPVGTVAIPEPAALGLLGAGGLVLRRRRR